MVPLFAVVSLMTMSLAGMGISAAVTTGNSFFVVIGAATAMVPVALFIGALQIELLNERRKHRTPVTIRGNILDARWYTLSGKEVLEEIDLEDAACVDVVRGSGVFSLHFWKESFREGKRHGSLGFVSADRIKRSAPNVLERVLSISDQDRDAVATALEATNEHKLYALR